MYKKAMATTVLKTGTNEKDFERDYEFKEDQKNVIIQGFSAAQLEEMLRSSTRNVAQEVVSCLIDSAGRGVLTEIIKWLSTSSQQHVENQTSILDNAARKEMEYTDSADEEEAADGGESFLGN